jgi:NADPH:quinone reductase-like Zn-dependent oxidoreductase
MVKTLGADHVFDYNDPSVLDKIKELTKESLAICSKTLPTGASYHYIGPVKPDRSDINFQFVMGVLYFNAPFKIQDQVPPAPPELFQGAVDFVKVAEQLLAEGKIKTHPKDVRKGRLRGVLDSIQDLRDKKVHGKKLIYVIE